MVSQQDLDFLASRKFTMQEICAMFNVSPAVLGLIEDANKSIMEGALYTHMVNNVIPRVEDFCELMNTSFIQISDPAPELGFENPIGEDKEMKLKESEAAVNAWMTIDEVREEHGLDALPGGLGAQLYVQGSLAPLNSIASATSGVSFLPSGLGSETVCPKPIATAASSRRTPGYSTTPIPQCGSRQPWSGASGRTPMSIWVRNRGPGWSIRARNSECGSRGWSLTIGATRRGAARPNCSTTSLRSPTSRRC
jgi:hypothetical protein